MRLIQQQSCGSYVYRGLYRVTGAKYAYATRLAPGQSLQRFDNCQNPKCQRKFAKEGRTSKKCMIEAHRWHKPVKVIRFTIEAWSNSNSVMNTS